MALLQKRKPDASICPSDVARALWPDDWRAHMDNVRDVAYQLVEAGTLHITQGGLVVTHPRAAKGAIRLKRR